MAGQTSIEFVDDLDGGRAVETIKFGRDDKNDEIGIYKDDLVGLVTATFPLDRFEDALTAAKSPDHIEVQVTT